MDSDYVKVKTLQEFIIRKRRLKIIRLEARRKILKRAEKFEIDTLYLENIFQIWSRGLLRKELQQRKKENKQYKKGIRKRKGKKLQK